MPIMAAGMSHQPIDCTNRLKASSISLGSGKLLLPARSFKVLANSGSKKIEIRATTIEATVMTMTG